MIDVNWNNFRAKFNGKERTEFESLCYHLFCSEFNKDLGIFRYKNQVGIETEPIMHNGKLIGFQSKYYETSLSSNKSDIKDSILKAKTKNQNLNKILFYLNNEFSESSKKQIKEPLYKIEIEKYAESINIEIEWRVPSHLERQLALEKNKNIAQHFFSLGKSIIDFIAELKKHTNSILAPIRSKTSFNGDEIKIDRSDIINNLRKMQQDPSVIIISGKAGVGKTAVIKDFYLENEELPFYIFKAQELNIDNINQLFLRFGDFTLSDFINEHNSLSEKYIIIDSAEKLSDIVYIEVIQEIISTLLNNKWKIIFTTRHSYLDDLKYQFIEVFNFSFKTINILDLTLLELTNISKTNNFILPNSERMCELLCTPFYLNEFLQTYKNLDNEISYSDFTNLLWNKQISKSSYRKNNTHLKREECFIRIAQKRASIGNFFVNIDNCEDGILHKLESDEIIKYDSNGGGYFITHDIYEEWALEKIIERAFINSKDYKNFYQTIGSSLPFRRSYRKWLSEKLTSDIEEITSLIEFTIHEDSIESFWKDEILISVLLSNYSKKFIDLYESKLLENEQELLLKIVFLLRIACKEIDESLLYLFGLTKDSGLALKTIFTKPKGTGWFYVIDFIYNHKGDFSLNHINLILPLLDEWNNKNKQGETTRKASLLSLFYYDQINQNDNFRYSIDDEIKNKLVKTIINGTSEIKDELTSIIDQIISNGKSNHRSNYYDLAHTILTSITDSIEIVKNLPEQVIRLADFFWFQIPPKDDGRYRSSFGVEEHFCLSDNHFDYHPASAFQTPIFMLLRYAPQKTVNFILSFTNRTVECYSNSKFKNEIEEITLFIDEDLFVRQYISNRLWHMYRGTQVSTYLLESIHMALEKWLLVIVAKSSQEILENWCKYLIQESKSASITSVVNSVVLAHPSKLFNIAKILFQTKEFFLYESGRLIMDKRAKSHYSIGYGLNPRNKIFEDERIKTCDDKHREKSLENLALEYQLLRYKDESEEITQNRQKCIWKILDNYYNQLPEKNSETESDKTWRMFLARMDRRKMNITTEEIDDGFLVNFNPEIDPKLKKHSEEKIKTINENWKHSALQLWSNYRFERNEEKYKEYDKYENSTELVVEEIKDIIENLNDKKQGMFGLFNKSIPAFSCSVLIRDFSKKLSTKDTAFCKKVIIEFAKLPLEENYQYQISDGVEAAVNVLPFLLNTLQTENDNIKNILLLILCDDHPIGQSQKVADYAIKSILHNLWEISWVDANSIFLGYLLLKIKFNDLREVIRKENHKNNIYHITNSQVIKRFISSYKKEIEDVIVNNISFSDLKHLDELDLEILNTAFELIPLETENKDHKEFLKITFTCFSNYIFKDDDKKNYTLIHRFLEKFAYFILSSPKNDIEQYLNPFITNFDCSRNAESFFSEFVSVEDRLNQYEQFWFVWDKFYPKIVEMCKDTKSYYTKDIIHNYLLAWSYWKEEAKDWRSLKMREKLFFKKVSVDIGFSPSVLYSISKVLNDIGSKFIKDGISWLSYMLENYKQLESEKLEVNTIYYIERIVRKFIQTNRVKIRKTKRIKNEVLIILNFLIIKGSVTGYLLRENIL